MNGDMEIKFNNANTTMENSTPKNEFWISLILGFLIGLMFSFLFVILFVPIAEPKNTYILQVVKTNGARPFLKIKAYSSPDLLGDYIIADGYIWMDSVKSFYIKEHSGRCLIRKQ
jgi:hypothetical protein